MTELKATVCSVKLNTYLLCTFLKLVSFGLSNEMMVTFKEENIKSLKHLFLKGYEDQDKNYAVYSSTEVYDHLNYIINQVMCSILLTYSPFLPLVGTMVILNDVTFLTEYNLRQKWNSAKKPCKIS